MPLRKWWWLIVAATLVATFSSYLATRQQPPIYRTRVTVMVGSALDNPNPNSDEVYLTQQLATTYADIVNRAPVRKATMAALGLSALPGYTAKVVGNTQLLEIAVTDTDPARAQAVANELANQMVMLSPNAPDNEQQKRQSFINQELADLETNIASTKDEISRKQADLANMLSARQIADTQAQIAGLQNKLASLQANYAALLANTERGALNSIKVVEPAELPAAPVGPQKMATILLAAAIGLILAAAAAYLMEYLDDSLKNPDDVQKVMGLTTLGAVPMLPNAGKEELTVLEKGNSAAAEAYRILRTNLHFVSVGSPVRTLVISSPAPSEGKSLTAANLAVAIAQAGKRVILVDADLHRPRVHRIFGVRNNVGLTSALLEETPALDEVLHETAVPGLHVLTSGPLPPNPAELLGSVPMQELTAQLVSRADLVIFDSPPVTALSDAAILGGQLDGVLMVVGAGTTRREVARRAMSAMERVNARVVGALLNRMPASGSGYYYYYYYYHGYSHYDIDGSDSADGGGGKGGKDGQGGGRVRGGQPEKGNGTKGLRRLLPGRAAPATRPGE